MAELCGSENFAILSITDREALHRLCEREMEIILRRARFLIERSIVSGSGFSVVHTTLPNVQTYSNTGLSDNTQYYYRVDWRRLI